MAWSLIQIGLRLGLFMPADVGFHKVQLGFPGNPARRRRPVGKYSVALRLLPMLMWPARGIAVKQAQTTQRPGVVHTRSLKIRWRF